MNKMCKICNKCFIRRKLGICKGKNGNFKYCFRRAGSIIGIEDTITPFNNLEELYDKYLKDNYKGINKKSLEMVRYTENTKLLMVNFKGYKNKLAIGFITH